MMLHRAEGGAPTAWRDRPHRAEGGAPTAWRCRPLSRRGRRSYRL